MDEQGGAGGVPEHAERAHGGLRQPHADRHGEGKTAAADTDEASRLDRPRQPEKRSGKQPGKASGEGTRWVSPRDE